MELRKHPRMTCLGESNWPPEWKGPYGPDNPLPRGEVGILIRVEPAGSVLGTPHCFVVMQWNQQEYFGSLYCDEEDFLLEIVELLRSSAGRPIAEIGSVDIPYAGADLFVGTGFKPAATNCQIADIIWET